VIAEAQSEAIGQAYDAATEEARRLQLFGAPTFVVNGECFWGDDRLDDAISWLRHGKVVA
jgi:2-hydroxychromene-2-carboxylate isomerase